jgi:hypothetical protein
MFGYIIAQRWVINVAIAEHILDTKSQAVLLLMARDITSFKAPE